jgi:hypothetical protein
LYACDTLLERLAQDLEHMTAKLGPFIQEAHAMVRQRPLSPQRHLASSDQRHLRDRWVRGAPLRAGLPVGGAVIEHPYAALGAEREGPGHRGDGGILGQPEAMPRQQAAEHDLQLIDRKGRPDTTPRASPKRQILG